MRTLTFQIHSPRGEDAATETGTVADLVRAIPYLLAFDTVPPRTLLNAVLASGREDAGMSGGCSWEPFELSPEEYPEIAAALASDGYHLVAVPEWVRSREEWVVHLDEVWNGVPASEMLPFHRELEALEERWLRLEAAGDLAGATQLKLRAMKLSAEMSARRAAYGWRDGWHRPDR